MVGMRLEYVDVHLRAAAALAGGPIWTLDKRIRATASHLGLAYAG
jgi:hypothetical protein